MDSCPGYNPDHNGECLNCDEPASEHPEPPMNCPKCKKPLTGLQYRGTAEDYDGVSEWRCEECKLRWGRWSGRELKEGELEKRYGR